VVQLADADIITREVLGWEGIHVFHFPLSSCSQKLRIFLNLKSIEWQSHLVDLPNKQNLSPWYVGINPRGLVPTLVHDGAVHIESNDILVYLEQEFPEPRLIPVGMEDQMAELLRHEDDLHLDLRNLSFKFVFAPPGPPKSEEDLKRYATTGSGTVQGKKDTSKDEQIAFWQQFITGEGISDDAARHSVQKFRTEFAELDRRLADREYLLGASLTVLDIAWFIYVNRLLLAGYPMVRLHPRLARWFQRMSQRPEFAKEVALPPPAEQHFAEIRRAHAMAGKGLEQIAGL
jgi:glutathione S-transferase